MNICYLDFWEGFDPNCNWFNCLFQDIYENREFNFNSTAEEADVIFASSFGLERYKVKNSKAVKIFYTGENERPDLDFGDFSLSFDFDTYGGRNFRLPHWYLYINWWNIPNFPHARISKEQLFYKWSPEEIYERKNFCSIVIGNPVANRIEVVQKLAHISKSDSIHGYGRVFNNPYSGCKVDLLKNYRWNICFENSIAEGYVTEKLLEAKVAGCIPIYYGTNSASIDFNEHCYINYANFKSVEDLVGLICRYDGNKDLFLSIANQSLFRKNPDLDNLVEFIRRCVRE